MIKYITAGESHGKGLTIIVEGFPTGFPLSEDYIQEDLARRQRGYGRGGRQLIEKDRAEILSGVRHGLTMGSPIAMFIPNKDYVNWGKVMSTDPVEDPGNTVTRLRAGHADMPGTIKYGISDVRNILERSSARETAARVAAGAVAKRFLQEFGIEVHSHVINIGGVLSKYQHPVDWEKANASEVHCIDPIAEAEMIKVIDQAKEDGDTIGGAVEVVATGIPIGLGSHVHYERKLDARLALALMSIQACKAVSIGEGWEAADLPGSQYHDTLEPITEEGKAPDGPYPTASGPWHRATNRTGGIEGGMSTGMPLVARFAIKPIATLAKPLPSVDLVTGKTVQAHFERSDVCNVPPAGVIGEAAVAFVLADAFLEKFGGDNVEETKRNFNSYQKTIGPRSWAATEG